MLFHPRLGVGAPAAGHVNEQERATRSRHFRRSSQIPVIVTVGLASLIGTVGTVFAVRGHGPNGTGMSTSPPAVARPQPSGGSPAPAAGHPSPADSALVPAVRVPRDAGELRTALEVALSERLVLADRLVRSRLENDSESVAATIDALGGNRDALSTIVTPLLSYREAQRFSRVLTVDTTGTEQYAAALANHDSEGVTDGVDNLRTNEDQLAQVLSTSTGGRIGTDRQRSGLEGYVDAVVGQANAYMHGDYARAYAVEQTGFEQMFTLARQIAAGAADARHIRGRVESPTQDLQSRFQQILGEHATLMSDVLRSGLQGSPDFGAAAAALNANTRTFAQAVDASLGARASRSFAQLWGTQVDGTVQFARATAAADVDRKRSAVQSLHESATQIAATVAGATGGRIRADQLAPLLNAHDNLLVQQAEDYAAQQWLGARRRSAQDYVQVLGLATPLANGIVATAAERSPEGGAQTGEGRLAREVQAW